MAMKSPQHATQDARPHGCSGRDCSPSLPLPLTPWLPETDWPSLRPWPGTTAARQPTAGPCARLPGREPAAARLGRRKEEEPTNATSSLSHSDCHCHARPPPLRRARLTKPASHSGVAPWATWKQGKSIAIARSHSVQWPSCTVRPRWGGFPNIASMEPRWNLDGASISSSDAAWRLVACHRPAAAVDGCPRLSAGQA